jgi:3-hydroxy-9,10-secoandrosta-1,3,5(10)-triene-9,17-dione monooxygenase reductase component
MSRIDHPPAVDPVHYREAIAHFATGVAVVTVTGADGEQHGMTANAVSSVSLEPVLLLVCIAHDLPTHTAVREAGGFNVNLLRAEQRDLAHQFARPAADKFAGVELTPGRAMPLLADALARFECRLYEEVAAGDHSIFIGEVERCEVDRGPAHDPLLYFRSDFHRLAAA